MKDECRCRLKRGVFERDPACPAHGDPPPAPPPSPQDWDAHHDVMTCTKPVCRETARIVRAREGGL